MSHLTNAHCVVAGETGFCAISVNVSAGVTNGRATLVEKNIKGNLFVAKNYGVYILDTP